MEPRQKSYVTEVENGLNHHHHIKLSAGIFSRKICFALKTPQRRLKKLFLGLKIFLKSRYNLAVKFFLPNTFLRF